jgi:hypothetical protein
MCDVLFGVDVAKTMVAFGLKYERHAPQQQTFKGQPDPRNQEGNAVK